MWKYVAILEGTSQFMFAYTLEGIRGSVEMAKYMGTWHIFRLEEVS